MDRALHQTPTLAPSLSPTLHLGPSPSTHAGDDPGSGPWHGRGFNPGQGLDLTPRRAGGETGAAAGQGASAARPAFATALCTEGGLEELDLERELEMERDMVAEMEGAVTDESNGPWSGPEDYAAQGLSCEMELEAAMRAAEERDGTQPCPGSPYDSP